MDECKIITYTPDYESELRNYLQKTFPSFSDSYFDYCIQQVSLKEGEQTALLVINSENKIVGCNLYFNTKAKILGEVRNVKWSYNTYLDNDYRKSVGLDLMLETKKIESLGIGLSEVNRKIQKKLKTQFFDGLYNYFFINNTVLLSVVRHYVKREKSLSKVLSLQVGKRKFIQVLSSSDLKIPNDGFWCKGRVDVEFVRDKRFFDYRFFDNRIYDYYVYKLVNNDGQDLCYFVVRPIMFKGIPTLFIVDFRYDTNISEYGKLIVKAANKLAMKVCMGGVFCMTNDPNISSVITRKPLHFKSANDLLAPKSLGIKKGMMVYVTSADSDADFMR